MTNDYLNENINISYDHRNLITEINRTNPLEDPPTEIKIRYRYDESGNRTRKTIYQSTIENPPPIPEEGDLPPGWIITTDEYYVRDAQGKEIAIYQGYNLDFWNVWGMGNEGRIKSTGTNYFYLKDHLGSIRAVLNQNNELVGAIDLDAWGYLSRSWDTTSTRYKFTGKERDNETGYDYFGARYFNSRTGIWIQTEPSYDKFLSFSPFNYCSLNPLLCVDPNGLGPRITINGNQIKIEFDFYYVTRNADSKFGLSDNQINTVNNFIVDIESNWKGNFSINEQSYEVTTSVNIHKVVDKNISKLDASFNKGDSYVIIKNATHSNQEDLSKLEKNLGVGVIGNYLYLLDSDKLNPYDDTGSHESWHLMGGEGHPVDLRSDPNTPSIAEPPDIIKGIKVRDKPSGKVLKRIFDINNIKYESNGIYNLSY